MSLLRGAVGGGSGGSISDVAESTYGEPGYGGWASGMVWQPTQRGAVGTLGAMQLSAVYACLRLLSEVVATLPLDTYTRSGGARHPFRPRPAYLSFDPPQGSRIEYLSQVMLALLTDGNAFVGTPRDQFGVPTNLIVLDPTKVNVKWVDSQTVYEIGGHPFTGLDVMHIKGMMLPGGIRGVSPITAARSMLGGALSAQDFGASFLANAAVPPAYIKVPSGGGTPDAEKERARRIGEAWNDSNGGTSKAGRVGVLMGDAELKSVAFSPIDAQWLESRQFGVQEVARIYGVPPHLIADSSNSTSWGSGLAEQNLAFGQLALRPWLERIEDGHTRLLSTHGLRDVFIKLNLDALLRASLKDRYDAYAVGLAAGFLVINDVLKSEDMSPVPWGDKPFMPATPPPGLPPRSTAAPTPGGL